MRCWSVHTETPAPAARLRAWCLAVLVLIIPLSACRSSMGEARFQIEGVRVMARAEGVELSFDLNLALSREAQRALQNGVTLTIELMTRLESVTNGGELAAATVEYRIHYLPLSDRFELLRGEQVSTFPRLRHLLAEIGRGRVALQAGNLPAGPYAVAARCRLDLQQLPPPMRLPALVSASWRHDSGWTSWPVELGAG